MRSSCSRCSLISGLKTFIETTEHVVSVATFIRLEEWGSGNGYGQGSRVGMFFGIFKFRNLSQKRQTSGQRAVKNLTARWPPLGAFRVNVLFWILFQKPANSGILDAVNYVFKWRRLEPLQIGPVSLWKKNWMSEVVWNGEMGGPFYPTILSIFPGHKHSRSRCNTVFHNHNQPGSKMSKKKCLI